MMRIPSRVRAGALVSGGLLAAALAPAAHAAGVAGGTTTVVLDKHTNSALKRAHVKLAARKPARLRGRKLTLPITSGQFDLATGSGVVNQRGSVRLSSGKRRVTVSSFRVAHRAISAKIHGKRLTVSKLVLSGSRYTPSPGATGATLRGARVNLTAKAAKALDNVLRTSVFKRGMRLGTVSATVQRKLTIESGTTTLAPDPGTSKTLADNGVTLGVVAPATFTPSGIAFPIAGGSLNAVTRAGTITHSGGLSLTKGSTTASLTQPDLSLGKTPSFSVVAGSFGRQPVAVVDLSGATIAPQLTATGGSISVAGAVVKLTPTAAGLLGAQFGVQLAPNAPLGTVSLTAQVS